MFVRIIWKFLLRKIIKRYCNKETIFAAIDKVKKFYDRNIIKNKDGQ